jgi:hypothetical protein
MSHKFHRFTKRAKVMIRTEIRFRLSHPTQGGGQGLRFLSLYYYYYAAQSLRLIVCRIILQQLLMRVALIKML